MKAIAQNEGFNINYFNFELTDEVTNSTASITNIKVYPNPSRSALMMHFSNSFSSAVSIKLFSMSGKQVQTFYEGNINSGTNTFRFNIDPTVASGMNFIEIKVDYKRYFRKIIVK